jgi:hypothetical protein
VSFHLKFSHVVRWGVALAGLAGYLRGTPARFEGEAAAAVIGSCQLDGPGGSRVSGRARSFTVSTLGRTALGAKDWYLAGGLQAERYAFSDDPVTPSQLQDVAAVMAVQCYRKGEKVAALTLRPGWYFGRRPVAGAWDVPFDLVSGVPLTGEISGVLGIGNARFYHHPLPVFGMVAPLGRGVRLQAVFPEPAVVYTPGPQQSWRLGGELNGGGFLADRRTGRAVVECTSYLVGVEFRHTGPRGAEWALSAGVEAVRSFDFFHERQRWHGGGGGFLKVRAEFGQ